MPKPTVRGKGHAAGHVAGTVARSESMVRGHVVSSTRARSWLASTKWIPSNSIGKTPKPMLARMAMALDAAMDAIDEFIVV